LPGEYLVTINHPIAMLGTMLGNPFDMIGRRNSKKPSVDHLEISLPMFRWGCETIISGAFVNKALELDGSKGGFV